MNTIAHLRKLDAHIKYYEQKIAKKFFELAQKSREANHSEGLSMKNDSNELLSDLLARWHQWAKGYQHVGGISSSPMFRNCKHGRQWDTVDEIISSDLEHSQMEAVDSIIMALCEVYRTALQLQARNLCTGRTVWTSPRLPQDMVKRSEILADARGSLSMKLRDAGIL